MTHLDGNAITEVERLVLEGHNILAEHVRPGQQLLLRDSGGDVMVFTVPLNDANAALFDVASFKAYADQHAKLGVLKTVFLSDQQIIADNWEDNHAWQGVLKLPEHPLFQTVQGWTKPVMVTQKDLVRLLRTQLRDHVDPAMIATFARLKFTSNEAVTSNLRPTSSALDSSIHRQVAQDNGEDAPETILLRGPVYDIPEARGDEYEFTVYVEYDYDKRAFILQTVHGDIRQAREQAISKLLNDLTDHAASRFPVLYGAPAK